jgi:glycosyltransferase involved in cell wall biosynthesis
MSFQLSVIIPVLNGMPYLRDMFESLEAQTYKNFFVILWDNGSDDGSIEEAKKWIPLRLPGMIITGEPLPLNKCLAKLVECANTEFIARMDADDVCLPDRFEKQVRFMDAHPHVDLVGMDVELIDPKGAKLGQQWRYNATHDDIVTGMMLNCPFAHPTIFFRKSSVLGVGNYQLPKPMEDYDLYLRMSSKCKLSNIKSFGLQYRTQNTASVTGTFSQSGELDKLALQVATANAQSAFGIRSDVFLKLRKREYPIAIWPLLQSALYRSGFDFRRFWKIFSSPVFISAARQLSSFNDPISWRVLNLIEKMSGKFCAQKI